MNKDYMLRMKSNRVVAGWEMRPGGMLVQKRNSDCNNNKNSNIKVRVKYGSVYHEVVISSQASFGELKKMLAGPTGVHTQDQKVIYKEKERDSRSFLDTAGVREGSKLVMIEDELSRERRYLESRKNSVLERASKEIQAIRNDVDGLAKQVAAIEMEINGGKKVVETVLLSLIENLMTQLIKLDAIVADGDVKQQRRMQVKRVQKYIESLDMLKMRNSMLEKQKQYQHNYAAQNFQKKQEYKRSIIGGNGNYINEGAVVVTTKWETF